MLDKILAVDETYKDNFIYGQCILQDFKCVLYLWSFIVVVEVAFGDWLLGCWINLYCNCSLIIIFAYGMPNVRVMLMYFHLFQPLGLYIINCVC